MNTELRVDAEAAVKTGTGPFPAVIIVCLSIRHGGVDVRVVQTARALQRQGADYRVVVVKDSRLQATLEAAGLRVHPLERGRGDPRIVRDLVGLARQIGAGVIDAHNTQSLYWASLAAVAAGIPGRVATVHSIYREAHANALRSRLHEGAILVCKAAGFRFLAVSRNVERYLLGEMKIPAARVLLSQNGMEQLNAPPAPFDLEAETRWPPDAVVLGMIGRLDPVKGHRFLLEALRDLVAEGDTRSRLLIVGTGREEARLRAMVADFRLEKYVHFAGFRDDVPSLLTRIDLFCLPSISEGLPYSVLEAARQSVPVLASRLEGAEDIFTDDQTIFFTPATDVAAIRTRLEELLDDPALRQRVGAAAKRLFDETLQVERMATQTLEVYQDAAGGARQTR